jgi:hypothetical protein
MPHPLGPYPDPYQPQIQDQASVLEELQAAYAIIAATLGRAPQLYDCHLEQALLVLAWSIKRARRSPKLRPPPRYREQELPF